MNAYRPHLLAITLVATVFPLTANAQPGACKSLEQDTCVAEQSCRWVASYQRSDGRTVKAYCRSAPRQRAAPDLATKPAGGKDD